jgi:hypothetical protein
MPVAMMAREHSRAEVVAAIAAILSDFCCSLNLHNPMTREMIVEGAAILCERFYFLSLADFRAGFDAILSGRYGTITFGTNVSQIAEKLGHWDNDQRAIRMKESGKSENRNIYEMVQNEAVQESLKLAAAKLDANRPPAPTEAQRKKTMVDEFMQWCHREFDRRYMKAVKANGARTITAYGRQFDIQSWLEFKLEQLERITVEKKIIDE